VNDEDGLEWLARKAVEMLNAGEPTQLCDHVWQTRNIILRLAEWKAKK
jgi:hypothetical protein